MTLHYCTSVMWKPIRFFINYNQIIHSLVLCWKFFTSLKYLNYSSISFICFISWFRNLLKDRWRSNVLNDKWTYKARTVDCGLLILSLSEYFIWIAKWLTSPCNIDYDIWSCIPRSYLYLTSHVVLDINILSEIRHTSFKR